MEDQNIEKLYEALGKIPDLVETTEKLIGMDEKNNRDYSAVVKAFNTLKAEVKSCQEAIAEAKQAFAKPVQIEDKNVHVTADQISVTQAIPKWVADMGKEYKVLKEQELSKKKMRPIEIGGSGFSKGAMIVLLIILAGIGIWWGVYKWGVYPKSMEAYAQRAYEAAKKCDFTDPGGAYQLVRENWEIDKEATIHRVEIWEGRAKTTMQAKAILSELLQKGNIIVDDYKLKSGESVFFFHFEDDEADYIAHFWPDGRVAYVDASKVKVKTIEDANRQSKNKAWEIIREAFPSDAK